MSISLRAELFLEENREQSGWSAFDFETFIAPAFFAKFYGLSKLAEPKFAWEPVTPHGVAAFARASLQRLLVVQCLVAGLATAAVAWLLLDGVFPTINQAVNNLPDAGTMRDGTLDWHGDNPMLLAEGKILAFKVDLQHGGALRSPADFQFEFGKTSVRAFSLFGESEWNYPPGFILAANRSDARPAWGAWSPEIFAGILIGTFLSLLVTWAVLATVYFFPVWLICFFTNRDLGFAASWKLAGAAALPGALLLTLFIVAYDLGFCDLIQLSFAFGMHFITGWIYLFVSPLFLNRALPARTQNPFQKP